MVGGRVILQDSGCQGPSCFLFVLQLSPSWTGQRSLAARAGVKQGQKVIHPNPAACSPANGPRSEREGTACLVRSLLCEFLISSISLGPI